MNLTKDKKVGTWLVQFYYTDWQGKKKKKLKRGFRTKDEYMQFIEGVKDKPMSYMAFQILYWTGMRIGELLALSFNNIDFENRKISISKTYTRIDGKDLITTPKTPKSNRKVNITRFLIDELNDYIGKLYGIMPGERIFHCTSSYLTSEMKRGVKNTGVQKIRLHDLRHSHASLLVEMGVSPLEMAERLGHEKIETTLNTYSHLYPNKQAQLADRLDGEFEKEEEDEL